MLSINCICCAFGPGSIASRGLLFGAETASRNWRSEWDALSGWSFKRKVHPGIRAWNGTHFPVVVHLETASQFERSFWDTLSVRPTIRKVHPVLSVQTGTRFPRARLLGKRVPDWQDAMRQVAVQRPYSSISLSHVGSAVCRMPAVCSFFANMPAERTSFMVKRSKG